VSQLQIVDEELRAIEFRDEGQAKERFRPYVSLAKGLRSQGRA
jgi:hypothetical protein